SHLQQARGRHRVEPVPAGRADQRAARRRRTVRRLDDVADVEQLVLRRVGVVEAGFGRLGERRYPAGEADAVDVEVAELDHGGDVPYGVAGAPVGAAAGVDTVVGRADPGDQGGKVGPVVLLGGALLVDPRRVEVVVGADLAPGRGQNNYGDG